MSETADVHAESQGFNGADGTAERLPIPDIPEASETVAHWLLRAPMAHPAWSQYVLACVRLRDVPGLPPPHRQFQGSTHEIFVVALDPEHGPYDAAKMAGYMTGAGGLPFLTPINIVEQFIASDEEMRLLTAWAAWGVCRGVLWPETSDAPEKIRTAWRMSLTKTLAHIRNEMHAP